MLGRHLASEEASHERFRQSDEQENQGLGVQHAVAAHTEARKQTKEQFVDELVCLHQRISALNPSETQREAIETDLNGIRQRLQYLLAVSPAVIYATRASGDHTCTFVSRESSGDHGVFPAGDDH